MTTETAAGGRSCEPSSSAYDTLDQLIDHAIYCWRRGLRRDAVPFTPDLIDAITQEAATAPTPSVSPVSVPYPRRRSGSRDELLAVTR